VGYEHSLQILVSQRLPVDDKVLQYFEVCTALLLIVVGRLLATSIYASGKTTRNQWVEDITTSLDEKERHVVSHVNFLH